MIKPLTKIEFIDVATNGIKINLYENEPLDYIENLVSFIEDISLDYYVDDYSEKECSVSILGNEVIKVILKKETICFYLYDFKCKSEKEIADVGKAIRLVYMHSIAWGAINNDGKINQPVVPWPV